MFMQSYIRVLFLMCRQAVAWGGMACRIASVMSYQLSALWICNSRHVAVDSCLFVTLYCTMLQVIALALSSAHGKLCVFIDDMPVTAVMSHLGSIKLKTPSALMRLIQIV